MDELRGGGPRLHARHAFVRLYQGNPGPVDAGNGLRRELRHVAEQIDHPAGAGHEPGHPAQPGMQIDVIGLQLRGAQLRFRWRRATGLRVVLGHGEQ